MKIILKFFAVLAMLVTSVFSLTACSAPTIQGVWVLNKATCNLNGIALAVNGIEMSLDLKEDKQCELTIFVSSEIMKLLGQTEEFETITTTGTWVFEEDFLTINCNEDLIFYNTILTVEQFEYKNGKLILQQDISQIVGKPLSFILVFTKK